VSALANLRFNLLVNALTNLLVGTLANLLADLLASSLANLRSLKTFAPHLFISPPSATCLSSTSSSTLQSPRPLPQPYTPFTLPSKNFATPLNLAPLHYMLLANLLVVNLVVVA